MTDCAELTNKLADAIDECKGVLKYKLLDKQDSYLSSSDFDDASEVGYIELPKCANIHDVFTAFMAYPLHLENCEEYRVAEVVCNQDATFDEIIEFTETE
ncbi:hypothetical protein IWW36_002874, partial [Coemansia brasiliensis]